MSSDVESGAGADITQVGDGDAGSYLVTTEASTYVLDLQARTLLRIPGTGAGSVPDLPPAVAVALRRDFERVPLIEVVTCQLGAPAGFLLDLRRDGVLTFRQTTHVRALQRLPETPDYTATHGSGARRRGGGEPAHAARTRREGRRPGIRRIPCARPGGLSRNRDRPARVESESDSTDRSEMLCSAGIVTKRLGLPGRGQGGRGCISHRVSACVPPSAQRWRWVRSRLCPAAGTSARRVRSA